jgi:two-component system, OmpR family, response regulator
LKGNRKKARRVGTRLSFLRWATDRGQLSSMAIVSSQASGSIKEAGLRGRLEQFGLATVLTFLDLERRSGELILGGDREIGRLWLRQGRVIRARIEGSRRTRKPAVYEMLNWAQGRFAFAQTDVAGVDDEISAPTPMLLIEAARRIDEQAGAPA